VVRFIVEMRRIDRNIGICIIRELVEIVKDEEEHFPVDLRRNLSGSVKKVGFFN